MWPEHEVPIPHLTCAHTGFLGRNRDWDLVFFIVWGRNRDWDLVLLLSEGVGRERGWQGAVLGSVGVQGPVLLPLALGPCSGCGVRAREIRGDPQGEWDAGCGSRDPFRALLELVEKLLLLHGGKGSHGVGCGSERWEVEKLNRM